MTFVGFPLIEPVVAFVTAVPEIERGVADISVQAFVVSLKLLASKCMYGVSVTRLGFEARYVVPDPFAAVFHPPNVNPVFTKLPELGAKFVIAALETATVGSGTVPPELVLPL